MADDDESERKLVKGTKYTFNELAGLVKQHKVLRSNCTAWPREVNVDLGYLPGCICNVIEKRRRLLKHNGIRYDTKLNQIEKDILYYAGYADEVIAAAYGDPNHSLYVVPQGMHLKMRMSLRDLLAAIRRVAEAVCEIPPGERRVSCIDGMDVACYVNMDEHVSKALDKVYGMSDDSVHTEEYRYSDEFTEEDHAAFEQEVRRKEIMVLYRKLPNSSEMDISSDE